MEAGGGPGEVPLLGHGDERLELAKFHSSTLLLNLITYFYWTS
jgi:hypothetical protein